MRYIGYIVVGVLVGVVIEGLHWAFFEPKPISAWIAVVAATLALIKWAHWELDGRPEEPSQDEKDYAAWFDA
jgi:hypothetical protein